MQTKESNNNNTKRLCAKFNVAIESFRVVFQLSSSTSERRRSLTHGKNPEFCPTFQMLQHRFAKNA